MQKYIQENNHKGSNQDSQIRVPTLFVLSSTW